MSKNRYNRPLIESEYYHIYNRGNNKENLFYSKKDYLSFLDKYSKYLNDFLDTFAYCLLPNHFHFFVRVKKDHIILEGKNLFTSKQFQKLFISHAHAINKQFKRKGSLFQKPFKRLPIESEPYFFALIRYIHNNPKHHGLQTNLSSYPYSSYVSLLSDKPTQLCRQEVLDLFGGRRGFIEYHENENALDLIDDLRME